ncbi:MAG: HEPN domain-containing protein [Candidatus Aenigmarchaeota archaeon]|nr:HEPN domain-containing protein [Candidatus Aenigmarchaeota archaeon]
MRENELEGRIAWCARKKDGIRMVSPSDNLCDAYLKKANDALRSMRLNLADGIMDWTVDTAYYARYHAVYALLQKCGIKSEIHDCSIAAAWLLFREKMGEGMLRELENAKQQRINLTYYTNRLVTIAEIKKNAESAPAFVLAMEKIISEFGGPEEIAKTRDILKRAIS